MVGVEINAWDDAKIIDNNVTINQDSDTHATYNIRVNANKSCIVANNTLRKVVPTTAFAAESAAIFVASDDVITDRSSILVTDNLIIADGFKFLLRHLNFDQYVDNITFSNNKFGGTPETDALAFLIIEEFATSDGTNFRIPVEFAADDYIQTLSTHLSINGLLLPGKKTIVNDADASPVKIELAFAPTSEAGFLTLSESMGFIYISATSAVGTIVRVIEQEAGTFGIETGNTGVSISIDPATGYPLTRTTGYLKAWASI